MIFISIALRSEAIPIIEKFNLKEEEFPGKFSIYSNGQVKLVITGIGKINSAIGTTMLLLKNNAKPDDVSLNIGICGSNDAGKSIGNIFLIHKITDISTGKDYYPDMSDNPFTEAAITTSDIPVFDKSIFEKNTLVDMEASGFFEAASFFVKPDRIHIVKILSDYMEKERITREFVQNLMKKNLEAIENYLEKLDHSKKEFSAGAITSLCEKLTGHFQLTTTQSVQLKKKITAYMVRNKELPVFLSDYADKKTESKASTKILLGEIFSKLDKN